MVNGVGQPGGDGSSKPIQPSRSILSSGSTIGAQATELVRGLISDVFQADSQAVQKGNRGIAEQLARVNNSDDMKVDKSVGFSSRLASMLGRSTRQDSGFGTIA